MEVVIDTPITVGVTVDGMRRIVPIRGGRVYGPHFDGRILDAGADFQRYPEGNTAYLSANYVLELEDGQHIFVENHALRTGSTADLQKLMAGDRVDPARIYFRCVPRLTADHDSPYAWVNRTLFLGTGERAPNGVRIEVFQVH